MTFLDTLNHIWDPTQSLLAEAEASLDQSEPAHTLLPHLQFQLSQRLGSPYLGESRTFFKGHGMELLHLREYQPGDDIRKIDWNVLARTGVPHIKEHYEERQVSFWFVLDGTASMQFGHTQPKWHYAKQLIGLLGLIAHQTNHRLGFILWLGNNKPVILPPQAGMSHLQQVLHTLQTHLEEGPTYPIETFPHLPSLVTNHSWVVLLSDFLFLDTLPEVQHMLTPLRRKHDVMTLMLVDPVEANLVYGKGWLPMQTNANEPTAWVNTSDRWMLKSYRQAFQAKIHQRQQQLSLWSQYHMVQTNEPPIDTIVQLLRSAA